MSGPTAGLAAAYEACERLVREFERDRWLASLFVPAAARPHVHALWAYSLEVSRVRELVRDPAPGEIRLQWWVDALTGPGHGDVRGHPVAAALLDTADRFALSRSALAAVAEARRFDLYDDAMPSLNDLEGYAGETVSTLLQQASIVACGGEDPGAADLSGHGGVAVALAGVMRALPITARRGQCYLPVELLARHGAGPDDVRRSTPAASVGSALAELRAHARHHLDRAFAAAGTADPRCRPVHVLLGLVEPYLAALSAAEDPFSAPVDVAAWRKPLALWRTSRRLA